MMRSANSFPASTTKLEAPTLEEEAPKADGEPEPD